MNGRKPLMAWYLFCMALASYVACDVLMTDLPAWKYAPQCLLCGIAFGSFLADYRRLYLEKED